jgi:hypothetical protein
MDLGQWAGPSILFIFETIAVVRPAFRLLDFAALEFNR